MKNFNLKLKISLLLILALLVAAVAVSCGEETAVTAEIPVTTGVTTDAHEMHLSVGEGEYSFDFAAVFADGTTTLYTVSTDCETVGEALLELELIDGEDGAYGLYVKSVCGVVADYDKDQTYWALYVNGEMSMVGADSVKCAEATLVEFKVEK